MLVQPTCFVQNSQGLASGLKKNRAAAYYQSSRKIRRI